MSVDWAKRGCKTCDGTGWKNVAADGEVRRVVKCECVAEVEAEERERLAESNRRYLADFEDRKKRGLLSPFESLFHKSGEKTNDEKVDTDVDLPVDKKWVN